MKRILPLFGLALLGVIAVASCLRMTTTPPGDTLRSIYPIGTSTPAIWSAGVVIIRDEDAAPSTAVAGQAGSHWNIYWNNHQTTAYGAVDWNAMDTRVAAIETAQVDPWLEVNLYHGRSVNPATATDVVEAPTLLPRVTYGVYKPQSAATAQVYDIAPDYCSQELRDAYADFVRQVIQRYDDRVAGYQVTCGYNSECYNVGGDMSDYSAYKGEGMTQFEKAVPCQCFLDWVQQSIQAHRQYTDKPLFVSAGVAACQADYADQSWEANKKIMLTANPPTPTGAPAPDAPPIPTPLWVGYKTNTVQSDSLHAQGVGANVVGWGVMDTAEQFRDNGGVAFEPYGGPGIFGTDTEEKQGGTDMLVYGMLNYGADNLFLQKAWLSYISADAWYAITRTAGTHFENSPAAWVVFRDAEYRTQGQLANPENRMSGTWGPFTHLADVAYSTEPTRKCTNEIYSRTSANTSPVWPTPQVCSSLLAADYRENYNTLYFPASTYIGVDIDDRWAARFQPTASFSVTLRYLNSGTDTIRLAYQKVTGGVSAATYETITKTNTGAWYTAGFTLTDVRLSDAFTTACDNKNGHPNGCDFEIRTMSGADTLHRLFIDYLGDTAALPTQTPTLTRTPTKTPTASHTPDPNPTATNTPTVIATVAAASAVGYPDTVSIYRLAPENNFDGYVSEAVQWGSRQANSRALLQWPDLTLPVSNTTVTAANLTLYVSAANCAGCSATQDRNVLMLQELNKTWDRAGATWIDTGAAVSDTIWSFAGADWVEDDYRALPAYYAEVPHSYVPGVRTVTIDVTQSVQRWLMHGTANYGWRVGMLDPCAGGACSAWVNFGSDVAVVRTERPLLSVTFGLPITPTATTAPSATATALETPTPTSTASPTVTDTPTSTATPDLTQTATNTPTATSTSTSTPTPATGLRLNEVCNDPAADLNLDGFISTNDRAVEVINWGSGIDLEHYRLEFYDGKLARTYSYIWPRGSRVWADNYKVVWGEDTRDLISGPFTIPLYGRVRLYDPDGVELDALTYNWQGDGTCWARIPNGGGSWTFRTQTLGKVNQ